MKKFQIGWVFILAIVFSACNTNDHKITQRLLSQQGHFVLLHPDDREQTLVFDSAFITEPTVGQKIQITKHDGTIKWAYIFWGLAIGSIIYGIAKSNNPGKRGSPIVICGCLAVVMAGAGAGVINWAHTKEVEIPKITYDSLLKADGDLHKYWDKNLFK